MKFRTEIIPSSQNKSISYSDHTIFMGSCFSENILKKMDLLKFKVTGNPYGIVYNPISLAQQLQEISERRIYTSADLQFNNERWFSYQHHSDFSFANQNECLTAINTSIQKASTQLRCASHLFLTFGTAWAYSTKENAQWVNNCHKIPAKRFNKKLLEVDTMVTDLMQAITVLKKTNPNIQVVFSVSPIRHLSDGAFENQLSKGRLFEVIHQLITKESNISYFNAFELIMDDLRDYRFFKDDLIHPSEQAISYVWEKFATVFFTNQTEKYIHQVEKLIRASNHRPFNSSSEAHQNFLTKTISAMEHLEKELSISFDQEKESMPLLG